MRKTFNYRRTNTRSAIQAYTSMLPVLLYTMFPGGRGEGEGGKGRGGKEISNASISTGGYRSKGGQRSVSRQVIIIALLPLPAFSWEFETRSPLLLADECFCRSGGVEGRKCIKKCKRSAFGKESVGTMQKTVPEEFFCMWRTWTSPTRDPCQQIRINILGGPKILFLKLNLKNKNFNINNKTFFGRIKEHEKQAGAWGLKKGQRN